MSRTAEWTGGRRGGGAVGRGVYFEYPLRGKRRFRILTYVRDDPNL